jgi:hypothetical protein
VVIPSGLKRQERSQEASFIGNLLEPLKAVLGLKRSWNGLRVLLDPGMFDGMLASLEEEGDLLQGRPDMTCV